ncbi:Rossmann-like and DUF2520 domain-containing protein [Arenibaculum sp.]|uniref:Rossmann-like and DUF2520 domain-containing protein n=1 Tax=Arenibaculum sp. TaxID=2865862 RepID=UPI002E0D8F44|nr:DUF2520 domain-containing protein [Arenibaculum sp.]
MTTVSFIGAGRVASVLGRALSARGVQVACVASRRDASARRLAAALPGCEAGPAQAAAARSDVVFVTVPDDALAEVASSLSWRPGSVVLHCSGGTEVGVLAPAASAGALTGGFHPLQNFADPDIALGMLEGCAVAVEGDGRVAVLLERFAALLGMTPIRLPPEARTRYHAGANYAASFLLSALGEAVALWRSFGVDEDEALRALLPLSRATLEAVAKGGLAHGLSGPFSRGDAGAVAAHLDHLGRLGADHADFYRSVGRRQVEIAAAAGRLEPGRLRRMTDILREGTP